MNTYTAYAQSKFLLSETNFQAYIHKFFLLPTYSTEKRNEFQEKGMANQ
jgi:hypothetical protein